MRSNSRGTPSSQAYGRPAANLKRAAAGRVCTAPGCTTTLSSYNAEPTCSQHGGWGRALPGRR
jgi:hypothetical protein